MANDTSSRTSTRAPTANMTGEAFVRQYYDELGKSHEAVHRYDEKVSSRLTRAEAGPDGLIDTVVSRSEIKKKIMSLDYSDFKAEIFTVDSQESLMSTVHVMVTGALFTTASGRSNFVQSFLLAPRPQGGYTLWNDMFRYLDGELGYVSVDGMNRLGA